MKTNKINVVLSLNKTTITDYWNNGDQWIPASGAACGTGKTANAKTVTITAMSLPDNKYCIACDPNKQQTDCRTGSW